MASPLDIGATQARRVYRFEALELRPDDFELRNAGKPVIVQPKPFSLLVYLIEQRDHVVSSEELLHSIWRGVTVSKEALAFAVHAARKAIGDDGSRQRLIKTIPKRGYRFVGKVEEVSEASSEVGPRPVQKPRSSGSPQPAFVGRQQVLARFEDAFGDVEARRGRTVLLSGEAGIGKTRTAEEAARLARERGWCVVWGRCVEGEGAPAFWPWVQAVRTLVGLEVPSAALRILGSGAPEIARMIPELRDDLPDLPDAPAVDDRTARFLLFDSIAGFLSRVAGSRSLLLILDDMHRADLPSILLFEFLTREIQHERILLLGTYREGELHAEEGRSEPMARIVREPGTISIGLEGLTVDEIRELVEVYTRREPSEPVVDGLRGNTNGNPFFLTQLLILLESDGRLSEVESEHALGLLLPRRVQDAIIRQVEGLPKTCRDLLDLAAVVGREFSVEVLRLAARRSRERILADLDAAERTGIVVPQAEGIGFYRFVHVLVRDALYQAQEGRARARAHARVGRAIERLSAGAPGADSAILAHHFVEAVSVGEAERALRYAALAGEWACRRVAFEQASSYFQASLRLLAIVDPRNDAKRCEMLIALGDAQTKAGDRGAATQTFKAVAQLAGASDLPDKLAEAALRYAPDFLAIETGVYDPDLVELLEAALQAIGSQNNALRARLEARLAVALHWCDERSNERDDLCANAYELTNLITEPAVSQYVNTACTFASLTIDSLIDFADLAGSLSGSSREEPLNLLQHLLRITSLLLSGRIREVEEEIETFTLLAEELRQPQSVWYADLLRATTALMAGRYREAHDARERYRARGLRVKDQNAVHSYMLQSVLASIDTGGFEEQGGIFEDMTSRFPRVAAWRAGLALFYSEVGQLDRAREEIDLLLGDRVFDHPKRITWFGTMGAVSFVASALGDRALAQQAHNALQPYATRMLVIGFCSFCWGSVDHLLAVLLTTLGRWEDAEAKFESAIHACSATGARPCLARAQYDYARMLHVSGRHESDRFHQCVASAARLATELGMSRLHCKIEAEWPGLI
jgi:DNA-binding winged helix-turn-helix (wHTH) protein/tetratricopeptide (TPR) repeat protein